MMGSEDTKPKHHSAKQTIIIVLEISQSKSETLNILTWRQMKETIGCVCVWLSYFS